MPIHAGMTDPGRVRIKNEDTFGIFPVGDCAYLYVVCDGVGGAVGGKEASELALHVFSQAVTNQVAQLSANDWYFLPMSQIKRILRSAATDASYAVHDQARANPKFAGMATTLVAALVAPHRAYVLNVGDSRLYTVNEKGVDQVTHDHSYIQYLLEIGRITSAQAKGMQDQNYITQAIGAYDHVDGDFMALDLDALPFPTYLLLCSDGLYSAVKPERMRRILLTDRSPSNKVEALIAAANRAGGKDNITAVVVSL